MADEENKDLNENKDNVGEDENKNESDGSSQPESKVDVQEFESVKKELETLKNFHSKILEEKKQEEQKRKDAQAKADKEVAEKEGDWQQVLELTKKEFQEQLDAANNRISSYEQKEQDRKVASEAQKIANQLAKSDTRRAGLLAEKVKDRLKLTEDGVKVVDENGELSSSNLESLVQEMKKNYDFLCDAVDSSGSGAKNGITGGNVKSLKDMSEKDLRALYRANPAKYRELKKQAQQ